jgi:uncharacterized oligopeptide transporter (OPT) family protein
MVKKPISPSEVLCWAVVSVIVAIIATALGKAVSSPISGWTLHHFVKGLLMMTISGYMGVLITEWLRNAFSDKKSQGSETD